MTGALAANLGVWALVIIALLLLIATTWLLVAEIRGDDERYRD